MMIKRHGYIIILDMSFVICGIEFCNTNEVSNFPQDKTWLPYKSDILSELS